MALDATIELAGGLGNRLAQQHHANTTDLDGPLPWAPTDADRQALVSELGRTATADEERAFEAGYRESMLRLDGNSRAPELAGPLWTELRGLLGKYGYPWPPDGTPELDEARLLVSRLLSALARKLKSFTTPGFEAPSVRESDAQDAASSAPLPVGDSGSVPDEPPLS